MSKHMYSLCYDASVGVCVCIISDTVYLLCNLLHSDWPELTLYCVLSMLSVSELVLTMKWLHILELKECTKSVL